MRSDRFTTALRLLLAAAALAVTPAARAQFPITESFMNATAPGWSLIGNARLTAAATPNVIDPAGSGWLRLTDNSTNQAGSAIYNTNFLSTSGITITFDYADYGGTGADGFSFYLIDGATASPTIGSSGGPLGYAGKYSNAGCATGPLTATAAGVTNGYVGIGFDEYGNYSACESGIASPGRTAQSVVIRGSGSLSATNTLTGFRYLTGIPIASVAAGNTIDGVARATPRHARIAIVNQKITVSLDFGAGFVPVISAYNLATATGQAALPATFKMGFSGSTGSLTNFHEIRNVKVDLPANLAITQAVAPTTVSVNDTVTFTITISNDPTNAANGSIINDAFPASLSNVSWTAATTNTAFGAPVLPRTSGTGNLAETIATFPKGSTITYTVTATVTAAAAGQVLANTVNLIPPSGLSNLLSNTVAANLTVNKMGSTTSFTSGTNPTVFGQPTTLTATVSGVAAGPPPPAPTGTVNFLDGATVVGSCTLSGGTCSTPVSSLTVGSHALTASYLGVTEFAGSTSSSVSQVVNKASTTTALASSANPSRSGQSTTLTATVAAVAPGAGTPSGLVTILDGGVSIGTCTLAAGACTLAVSSLTVATHPLTATYPGDGSFLASATSAALSQVVNQSLTSTTLASSVNPARFGQSTTLTATVAATAPGAGTPTGTVAFLDNGVLLPGVTCTLAAGSCTVAVSSLAVGTHPLTAAYAGTASFAASTSAAVSQVVNQALTSTTLASSVNPTRYSQPTTLTATVAVTSPGVGPATGTVTFLDGGVSIGSCTLSAGSCTLAVSGLALGTHPLTASYAATASFGGSTSAAVSQVVNQAASTTTLTAAPNPSVLGESVTVTATVSATAPATGTPTGTVNFLDNGVLLPGVSCTLAAGTCSVAVSNLAVGSHPLTASYFASTNYAASTSAGLSQVVNQASTATTIASSVNPAFFGQATTLSTTVSAVAPGAGTPTGTVTFLDGAASIGACTLTAGACSVSVTSLSVATHTLTASYGGAASFTSSASTGLTQVVDKGWASGTYASSVNPTVFGQPTTLTATVTAFEPAAGTPTGIVDFREGLATIGSCTLVAGTCSLAVSSLPVGTHNLTANYQGNANFFPNGTGGIPQVVNQAASATTLSAAPDPSVFGESVTLTAVVSAASPGAGTPAGTVTFSDGAAAVGSCTLSGGGCTFSTSGFAVGAHSLTASYGGDTRFVASGSAASALAVAPAPTSTSVASSLPTSTFGDPLTFTATVAVSAPGAGVPTGQVRFFADGVALGDAALDGAGHAGLPVGGTTLSVGPHAITAQYLGDGSFAGSASPALTQSVSHAPAIVALASSVSPAVTGQPVALTATVSVAGGLPDATGSITFKEGAATLGSCTLSSGTCTLSLSTLPVGTHTVTATWSGDANFDAATSNTLTQQVDPAVTETTLDALPVASVFGQPVTFTATITVTAPGAGAPSGNVTFAEGNVVLGSAPVDGAGHAALELTTLAIGSHDVLATYGGDPGLALSISPASTVSVGVATATVAASAAPSPSVFGEPVTFTVTVAPVAPSTATPAGTVTLREGATVLGTAVLSGGTATITTALLLTGDHALAVDFTGDGTFTAAPGDVAVHVDPGATSTDVAVTPNPATYGDTVTFSASVTVLSPAAGDPSGLVTFSVDGVAIGTGAVSAGVASFTTAPAAIPGGAHDVVTTYLGDPSFAGSASATATLVVSPAPVTLLLAASPPSPVFGQPVTLTASATSAGGVPSGAVTFLVDGLPVGTVPLSPSGQAALPAGALPVGDHLLSIDFTGSADWQGASAAATLAVTRAPTTLALAVAPASPVFGQAVTLTATVAVTAPGAGAPGGLVSFNEGAAAVGSCTLTAGTCSLTVTDLAVGAHALTATWAGDADLLGAAGAASVTVAKASTGTSIAVAPAAASFGDSVRLIASVTAIAPGAGQPGGTVTFTEGGVTLGVGALDASGQATLDLASLAVGAHAITAGYDGDGSFSASASASAGQVVVAKAAVTVIVVANPSPTTAGELVTFTVTVTSSAGTPSGAVTVRDASTILGSCTLAAGSCTVTSASLPPGTTTITAASGGDASFAGGSGSTTLVVGASTTVAAVTTSRNPTRAGRPVTFTATLTSPNGLPTGTVTFKDGFGGTPVTLGTATLANGVAQLTIRTLVKGLHPITVEYAGAAPVAPTVGTLPGDETVENSPPVAGSGTALAIGPAAASGATLLVSGALDGGDLTLETWVRPTWTSPAQVAAEPIAVRLGTGSATQVALGVSPDRTAVTATVGGNRIAAVAPMGDGAWHHLALVAQGDALTLRVDGALAATFSGSRAAAGNTLLAGEGFVGEIDEIRAWTTARTAEQLNALSHQPLAGTEPGLAGLWRMDEGDGLELFDAGPLHLDGTVQLSTGASSGFTPSTAWRDWSVISGEPLDPVHAGYDLDGDPLTLTVSSPAGHGLASVDPAALTVGYQSQPDYLGADALTYRLDDGTARSDYQLALQVTPVLVCQVSADCTGTDLCVQGVCRPENTVALRAGGCGCSTSGSEAVVPWALLLLLGRAWRRRRTAGDAP